MLFHNIDSLNENNLNYKNEIANMINFNDIMNNIIQEVLNFAKKDFQIADEKAKRVLLRPYIKKTRNSLNSSRNNNINNSINNNKNNQTRHQTRTNSKVRFQNNKSRFQTHDRSNSRNQYQNPDRSNSISFNERPFRTDKTNNQGRTKLIY